MSNPRIYAAGEEPKASPLDKQIIRCGLEELTDQRLDLKISEKVAPGRYIAPPVYSASERDKVIEKQQPLEWDLEMEKMGPYTSPLASLPPPGMKKTKKNMRAWAKEHPPLPTIPPLFPDICIKCNLDFNTVFNAMYYCVYCPKCGFNTHKM